MTRIEVLNDTIQYFWGRGERKSDGFNGEGCFYYPQDPSRSEGCAIGRFIKDKELCKQFDKKANSLVTDLFYELPAELQDLGIQFLADLQCLHDHNDLFNKEKKTVIQKMENHVNINEIIFPNE